ncbi:PAS domain-containing protein [Gemmatimonas sp.]|jgi:PAS domain S-box-containing protein|uniref:PAS domain-containing protein n=1 Tax=Gemmatimonas sp. TaxID=1962908 RepID=UPI0037BED255
MPARQLLAALTHAAILTDATGVVVGWNSAATALFGWSAAEMVGRPLIAQRGQSR